MSKDIFSLKGRVALVTGGGRGIGRAIALGLAKAGADVVVASRSKDALDKAAAEIRSFGQKSLAIVMDITDLKSVKNMAQTIIREFGKIDILVNNAGQASDSPFLKISEQEFDRILNVNLQGCFLVT